MLASPKFLNVCLPKAVVSVVLSKILARNVYVSRLCSLGENVSKAKIFKCMSPKVRSSCSFVKNPCKKYMCVSIVKTQRNSTQLNSTQSNCKSNFVGLDTVLTWNPPHPTHPTPPHATPNFSVTSRPARELKFGTDTH